MLRNHMLPRENEPRVSALVSTYNSARFLRGCLEDLEDQTIRDELEIVVVNSASTQDEDDIVREYERAHDNILYVRTPHRESIYAAWNRAILMASGEYLTNANTDDRHRCDALEIMSRALDENPDVGLVYAGYHVTQRENETFANHSATWSMMRDEYSRGRLLAGDCLPGPQPMWRRSIHEEYGLFDETYESAGDLEFWLRISRTQRFMRIPETLGLYLQRPDSVEYRDHELSRREAAEILDTYRNGAH